MCSDCYTFLANYCWKFLPCSQMLIICEADGKHWISFIQLFSSKLKRGDSQRSQILLLFRFGRSPYPAVCWGVSHAQLSPISTKTPPTRDTDTVGWLCSMYHCITVLLDWQVFIETSPNTHTLLPGLCGIQTINISVVHTSQCLHITCSTLPRPSNYISATLLEKCVTPKSKQTTQNSEPTSNNIQLTTRH